MIDKSKAHYHGADGAGGCGHGFVGMLVVFSILVFGLYYAATL